MCQGPNWCQHIVALVSIRLGPSLTTSVSTHDDVIKWKHFPRYWPFVRGIHRSPVNSPHKGQWRGALMFSLICVWINGWVNNREAGDLRRYRAHYDVTVMIILPVTFVKYIPWNMHNVNASTFFFYFKLTNVLYISLSPMVCYGYFG